MRITEETNDKLIVKRAESHVWIYFLFICFGGFFLMMISMGSVKAGYVEPRGKSRPQSGAVVVLFPVATILIYFYERRQNRKAIIMDSKERIMTVVGARTDKVPFAEIKEFGLDKTGLTESTLIVVEMMDGQRFGTGIAAPRGKDENLPEILQKLTAKLRQPPPVLTN
ncbi:MAG TPA: hypothetical protein VIL74_00845 [Pyrinomonadaceae bacterium]|jgi:hypothetical protein